MSTPSHLYIYINTTFRCAHTCAVCTVPEWCLHRGEAYVYVRALHSTTQLHQLLALVRVFHRVSVCVCVLVCVCERQKIGKHAYIYIYTTYLAYSVYVYIINPLNSLTNTQDMRVGHWKL